MLIKDDYIWSTVILVPTYEDISVSEPLVGDNVSVAGLKGQLDGIVRVEEVEEVESLAPYHQAHRVLLVAPLVLLHLTELQYKQKMCRTGTVTIIEMLALKFPEFHNWLLCKKKQCCENLQIKVF